MLWLTAFVAFATISTTTYAAPSSPKIAYVDVSVATLWTDPSKPRPVDAPALTNPVRIEKWLNTMTLQQYLDLTDSDRTQTQALYGQLVHILSEQKDWYEVAVAGQPTPKNTLGYPGWVPKVQLSVDPVYGQLKTSDQSFVAIDKTATAMLYRDPGLQKKLLQVSYDTRLPFLGETLEAVQVAVPGGVAFIARSDASVYPGVSAIAYPTGEDLVKSAELFLDRPYLWGGASGYAFDCSGLTHTIYDAHGITIPRDSDAQADFYHPGVMVARSALEAGDLIFYATNLTDPNSIYHVAMFAGNGTMIEAYGAGIPVRQTPVRFNSDYWGAERYLKSS